MRIASAVVVLLCVIGASSCSSDDDASDPPCGNGEGQTPCPVTTGSNDIDPTLLLKVGDRLIDPCTLITADRVVEVTTIDVAISGWRSEPGGRGCTIRTGVPEIEIEYVVSNADVIARDKADELVGPDTPLDPRAFYEASDPFDGDPVDGIGTSAIGLGRSDPSIPGLVHEVRVFADGIAFQVTLIGDATSYSADELEQWTNAFAADLIAAAASA